MRAVNEMRNLSSIVEVCTALAPVVLLSSWMCGGWVFFSPLWLGHACTVWLCADAYSMAVQLDMAAGLPGVPVLLQMLHQLACWMSSRRAQTMYMYIHVLSYVCAVSVVVKPRMRLQCLQQQRVLMLVRLGWASQGSCQPLAACRN
jgi:hypothetical protein